MKSRLGFIEGERLFDELRWLAIVAAAVIDEFQSAADDFKLSRSGNLFTADETRVVKDMDLLKVGSVEVACRVHYKHGHLYKTLHSVFIDPYGIYGYPSCYPTATTGATGGICARYPSAWKGGAPQYP